MRTASRDLPLGSGRDAGRDEEREPVFVIATDARRRLVSVKVRGFWLPEDVTEFFEREQEAVASLGVPPGSHRLLVDVREMRIQSQAVVERLRAVSDGAALKAQRFAFVVSPGLIRQQVRRAVADRRIELFEDERSALEYLTGG